MITKADDSFFSSMNTKSRIIYYTTNGPVLFVMSIDIVLKRNNRPEIELRHRRKTIVFKIITSKTLGHFRFNNLIYKFYKNDLKPIRR